MPTPRAAAEHYRTQRATTLAALVATRAAWQSMTPDFDLSWLGVGPRVKRILTAAQRTSIASASGYIPEVLEQLDIQASPVGTVIPESLIGIASDGRDLDSLLDGAVVRAKRAVADEVGTREALRVGRAWLEMAMQTQIADAGRVAAGLEIAARPEVTGYIRMLNPPSCSRCVILAGRFYRWNKGFERHPRCDCIHVPASEDMTDDIRTDPEKYFNSLSEAEQDKAFTKAGAQAIRDGADMNRVVNARRKAAGLTPAGARLTAEEKAELLGGRKRGRLQRTDVFGQQVFTTAEGKAPKVGRKRGAQLMPESIYELATDREEAIRLLKRHGYIT